MSSRKISIAHLNAVARQTAARIGNVFKEKVGTIKIYGVPRGGVTAAYAVAAVVPQPSQAVLVVVDDAAYCDVIVDDLIDSGATKKRYNEMYPEIPFFALFDKPKKWLVFPWEDTNLDAATDSPLRLLQFVGENASRGGLKETPKRFLKAWQHFTSGYKKDPAEVMKVFSDGAESYDEMVLVKNIPVYSQCEHHLVPFFGVAHVAYIPDGKIVGLSKLNRVVDIFARRLQVQERLTGQVATALEDNLTPEGVAVVLECRHLCMEARGICQQGHTTTTSAMRGVFRTSTSARMEFLNLIK